MTEPNTRVTAKLLAQKLGLSIATVDRALNNRGNVKKSTYDRIMAAIEELDYKPNKSASLLSRNKKLNIAVIFQTYPAYFWDQIEIGVNQARAELSDYGVQIDVIRTPNSNIEEQIEIIEQVIESNQYDGIAVSSDGSQEIGELIDLAIQKGIKTCTFNTDSPLSQRLFYVGCDYRDAGRLAAELMCKFVGNEGNIAFILETENMFQFQQKILGFRDVLDVHPKVKMIGPLRIERDRFEESLHSLKEELSKVDGIYLATGQLSLLAKQIKEWNLNKPLVGHDMDMEVYRFLQDELITATICQEPENQGYMAVKSLFEVLIQSGNAKVPVTSGSRLEVVFRENAKYYL